MTKTIIKDWVVQVEGKFYVTNDMQYTTDINEAKIFKGKSKAEVIANALKILKVNKVKIKKI